MKIAIYTLGCRTNQAESAGMAEYLASKGHGIIDSGQITDNGAGVDAVIVNTCTVTATADKKSRNAIRKLQKRHPGALLAVCGCLPQTEELEIDGIDLIGGTSDRVGFLDKLEAMSRGSTLRELPGGYEDTLPDARPIGRSRAYIKIQDGCDNRCAYCKVPQARGKSRSRPVESVLRAVKKAAEDGAAEIILTGIEISSFRPSLADLTVQACRAAAPVSVRLSSLHPDVPDEGFIAALKGETGFSPAFHLSLQSVCDNTLYRMNRRYTVKDIFEVFGRLREAWIGAVITADIIVGFPGEDDKDFAETFENLKKLNPDGLHVFPYSRRKGTPAADMKEQNTRSVKTERVRVLREEFAVQ
jgi:threonylcarbamoyladenosine tRNA methylthiotransferase MtaB